MKILLISNMYPDTQNPHYGVFVKRSKEQMEKKFEVEKIVIYKRKDKLNKLLYYLKHYYRVYKQVKNNNFNLIYVHYVSHNSLPLLFITKKVLKDKLILNFHGSDAMPERKIQQIFQPLVRLIVKKSNKIVVPSEYFKQAVSNSYSVDENKVFISPSSGVNTKVFHVDNDKLYSKYNLSPEFRYIGYVGRISTGKGWDDFLQAINILKDNHLCNENIKYIIVGDGPEINKFKSLVSKLNLERYITLLGLQSQENLKEIYNLLDLFVFPSKRKGESLGLVGLEAMACGVPVLGAKTGGIKEYVEEDVNGFLFTPGNYNELSDKIIKFLQLRSTERVEMVQKCLEKAEEFKNETVGENLNTFLKRIIYEKT